MYRLFFPLLNFFLLFSTVLSAKGGIDQYFKPASNKGQGHSLEKIDFIYLINLDQRPEKYEDCLKELSPYGVKPYRFSAVNGWKLTLKQIQDLGVIYRKGMTNGIMGTSYLDDSLEPKHSMIEKEGQVYFCHCMSRGAIGICLSHLSILQDAYNSGYQTIWVMEDDIHVIKDPNILSDLIAKLDRYTNRNWDILFTDRDTKNNKGEYVKCRGFAKRPNYDPKFRDSYGEERTPFGSEFTKIPARYGAYSMIIRRSGMEKLLNFFKKHKIFLPFDMDFTLPTGMRYFAVNSDVVSTKIDAHSDNGAPNYLKNQSKKIDK